MTPTTRRRTRFQKFIAAVSQLQELNVDYEISVSRAKLGVDRATLARALDAISDEPPRAKRAKRQRA